MSHRSSWGAPIWPPRSFKRKGLRPPRTPPAIARTRPGEAVARLGLVTGRLIDRRGGPRYGPPDPSSERGYAPLGLPRPSLGRAPAQPWRTSDSSQDGSSVVVGGLDMAPQILQAKGATPPSDSPGHRSAAPRRSRGAPRTRHRTAHRSSWGASIWPPRSFKRKGLRPPRTPPAIARTRPG